MRTAIKNIIIGLLSFMIVVSTSGINVFIHHCNCSEEESVSIIENLHSDCCDNEANTSCCIQNDIEETCCSIPVEKSHNICNSTSGCCKIIQQFVKIEDNYLLSMLKVSFEMVSSFKVLIPDNIDFSEDSNLRNITQYLIKVPPLFTGKSLVFFLNQLKVDLPALV